MEIALLDLNTSFFKKNRLLANTTLPRSDAPRRNEHLGKDILKHPCHLSVSVFCLISDILTYDIRRPTDFFI